MNGNLGMLVWLGKQLLAQADHHDIKIEGEFQHKHKIQPLTVKDIQELVARDPFLSLDQVSKELAKPEVIDVRAEPREPEPDEG